MDFAGLEQTLINAATAILISLISWGVAKITQYANSRIENEEIKTSLLITMNTLANSVKSTVQAMSAEGKLAVADGKIDKAELIKIQNKAFEHFSKQVAPKIQTRIKAHIEDTEGWMLNIIAAELQKVEKVTG